MLGHSGGQVIPTAAGRKAPGRAQNLIKIACQVCIFDGDSCQSGVTFDESNKALRRIRRYMTDKKKGEDCHGENDKVMIGKGSENHNTRAFTAKNVDKNRSADNVEFCQEDIKQVYHKLV